MKQGDQPISGLRYEKPRNPPSSFINIHPSSFVYPSTHGHIPAVQLQFTGLYPSGCSIECCSLDDIPASSSSTVVMSPAGDNDDDNEEGAASCSFGPSTTDSLVALALFADVGCGGGGVVVAGLERCCEFWKVTSLVTAEAPVVACSCCSCSFRVVELQPEQELTSWGRTSRVRTVASRLETLFSSAVMRSQVASEEEAGAAAACG